jgi:hypothetical protein
LPSPGRAHTPGADPNDLAAGFLTGSVLGGMGPDVVGGEPHAPRHECPTAGHHFQQAEANQPSALGGYEAAAQHDHGQTFGSGFDPGPPVDAGGCNGGASFDCGPSVGNDSL